MPLSAAFEDHPFIERALRMRQNPTAAYGVAVAAVAVATLVRWIIGGQVVEGLPFITYYPAIIIATLIGGFWSGILALVLSAATAWYLFLPPLFSVDLDQREAVSLLLFIFTAGINVAIVGLLDAAVERIMAQMQNVRILIESAPNGIVVVDRQGTIKLINASAEQLFGYEQTELLGRNIEVLVPERQQDTHRTLRDSFLKKPEARSMGAGRDLSGRRKDGGEFPIEIGLNPVSRNGRNGVLATVIDITERRRVQDHQQFLVRELNHRTQNLFAIIQAIATRSLTEGPTVAEAKEIFIGRLLALARAHTMLSGAAWEGALLNEIIKREFVGFFQQVSIDGCDIIIDARAAHQFALIVHELATNAVKHGALSALDGRISIEGKIGRLNGQALFSFLWKESGGPLVSEPTRKGFGSLVLLDAAKQFGQRVAVDYAPQGLSYELELPLSTIIASKSLAGQESRAALSEVPAGSV